MMARGRGRRAGLRRLLSCTILRKFTTTGVPMGQLAGKDQALLLFSSDFSAGFACLCSSEPMSVFRVFVRALALVLLAHLSLCKLRTLSNTRVTIVLSHT